MNEFAAKVYDWIARIPAGRVATYGQLAALAGKPRAARLVGHLVSVSPRNLSCHRVVRADGSLPPDDVFPLPGLQRHLLLDEGVTFDRNGRVKIKEYLWRPDLERKK
jgi:methylated-DNA-protein-cysteine methyltransferase-like protein